MGGKKWKQGLYQVINNDKYKGKRPLYFRSEWERKFMCFCDNTPSILEWSSESLCIRYFNPIKGKVCRYYPDFLIKYKDVTGKEIIELIEIKPYKQTLEPKVRKNKKSSTLLQESKTWAMNKAKWAAAISFCKERGIVFRIITEKDLYGKVSK